MGQDRHRDGLLVGLLVLAGLACVGHAGASPDGVLSSIKGEVRLSRGGGPAEPVVAATPLQQGDRIEVGAAAGAVIYYPNRPPLKLQPGQTFTVAAAQSGDRKSALARAWAALIRGLAAGFGGERISRPAATRGSLGGFTPPNPIAPRCTKIMTRRPTFRWDPVPGANKYVVTVGFYQTQNRIWSQEAKSTSIVYPAEAPPFEYGRRYFWEVAADTGTARVPSDTVWFAVLPEEEVRAVQECVKELRSQAQSPDEMGLAIACVYSECGLDDAAATELERLYSANPEDPTVQLLLYELYRRMERPDLAQKVWRGAYQVTDEQRDVWRKIAEP